MSVRHIYRRRLKPAEKLKSEWPPNNMQVKRELPENTLQQYAQLPHTAKMDLVRAHLGIEKGQQVPSWEEIAASFTQKSPSQSPENHSILRSKPISSRRKFSETRLFSNVFLNFLPKNYRTSKKPSEASMAEIDSDDSERKRDETVSLIEDRFKAEMYEDIVKQVDSRWETKETIPVRFFDVMSEAIRDDLLEQSRPILINEFADYENPYMMKRSTIKRLLEERCVRNKLDESLVESYLDRRPDLLKLRVKGKMPPEVVEPLMAFRGDVQYHFDARTNLENRLDAIQTILNGTNKKKIDTTALLNLLPENISSDTIDKNHPFCNHFGFESAVPHGFTGGIKMGQPRKPLDAELAKIRYPTLQRVAHSLPTDPLYRENVVHAIRLLERSKGWDYESKLQAISTLIEVWKNMGPSKTYGMLLDKALPIV
ncbi:hypothetical protein IE077_001084, partial [Cardiosporidium cionae]